MCIGPNYLSVEADMFLIHLSPGNIVSHALTVFMCFFISVTESSVDYFSPHLTLKSTKHECS